MPSNFGNDRVLKIEQVGKFNNWISKLCQQVELYEGYAKNNTTLEKLGWGMGFSKGKK